jgi:excisionase family DNA binding protein
MKLEPQDLHDLKPVIGEIVRAVLSEIDSEGRRLNGKLAYSEGEAAELLDVKRTVLRDCRLRGEISARKVGKEFRYSRDTLLEFLRAKDGAK